MLLTNLTLRIAGMGAVAVLALAACTAGGGSGGAADGDLTLNIVTPTDGATVDPGFEIQVESSVPLGEPESGDHHVHFYFDTDISSADYQIVYGDAAAVDRELTPGEHTIIASLRNADHSDAGPSDEITVTVGDNGSVETAPSDGAAPSY